MKLFGRTLEGFASAIAFLVVVFLVSGGLCGLSLGIGSTNGGWYNSSNTAWGSFGVAVGVISGIGLFLSFWTVVIVLIIWLISAVFRTSSGKAKENAQKLFDSDRDGDGENRR
jgi:hypothetical protein